MQKSFVHLNQTMKTIFELSAKLPKQIEVEWRNKVYLLELAFIWRPPDGYYISYVGEKREFIAYKGAETQEELESAVEYLANKWGNNTYLKIKWRDKFFFV